MDNKEKIKLVVEHMMSSYKPQLIKSDMVSEVIINDAYDRYLFKPSEIELHWLICRLRFIVADEEYQLELKKQDELDWHNLFYNDKW
jgi:hypothetical protein